MIEPTLQGEQVQLRLVRTEDLPGLHGQLTDLTTAGRHFPLGLIGEPAFRAEYERTGFWRPDEGMLLVAAEGSVVGEIEFYPISHYLHGYELSYRIFGAQHAGKGYATEAVALLSCHLLATKRVERLQLVIHPDNVASQRVATKCGFTREGTMRRCWFHRGEYHDLDVWSLLRGEAAMHVPVAARESDLG